MKPKVDETSYVFPIVEAITRGFSKVLYIYASIPKVLNHKIIHALMKPKVEETAYVFPIVEAITRGFSQVFYLYI